MNFCKQCGKELSEGTKFCGSCGAPVAAVISPIPEMPHPVKSEKNLKLRKSVVRVVLALVAVIVLCGGAYVLYQKEKPQSPLIGIWRAVGEQNSIVDPKILIFSPDGTIDMGTFASDKYALQNGNRLVLGSGNGEVEFTYTLNNNSQLTIHEFDFYGSSHDVVFERAGNLSAPAEIPVHSPSPLSKIISDSRDGSAACSSNLKQIALGIFQFLQDYNQTFQLSSPYYYATQLQPYLKSWKIFECPADKNESIGYVFNANLENVNANSLKNPANTVMLYEGKNGVLDFRHRGKAGVAFADGHVKFVTQDEAASLQWQP